MESMERLKHYINPFWIESSRTDKAMMLALFFSMTWKSFAPVLLGFSLVYACLDHRSGAEVRARLMSTKSISFWIILYFGFTLIGVTWASHSALGFESVTRKLSFLLVPVVFALGHNRLSLQGWLKWILDTMSLITIGLLFYAVFKSIIHPEDNHWAYFFESEFSAFIHRSYWATYCAIAAAWALNNLLHDDVQNRLSHAGHLFLLTVSTILTVSKAGIIILFVLFLIVTLSYALTSGKLKYVASVVILFFAMILLFFCAFPRVVNRFKQIPLALSDVRLTDNVEVESNTARLIMWSTAINVIKENLWIGSGTGSVKETLQDQNLLLGNSGVAAKKLDAHNQFLNCTVELGIIGLILFLIPIIQFIYYGLANHNWPALIMVVSFVLTMLFESFLETQAGIIPYCILTCLFASIFDDLRLKHHTTAVV
jgi:O-antigen ligase